SRSDKTVGGIDVEGGSRSYQGEALHMQRDDLEVIRQGKVDDRSRYTAMLGVKQSGIPRMIAKTCETKHIGQREVRDIDVRVSRSGSDARCIDASAIAVACSDNIEGHILLKPSIRSREIQPIISSSDKEIP